MHSAKKPLRSNKRLNTVRVLRKNICAMRTKRILLVDDDPLILELLRYTLQEAGYEVQTALDGEEALQLLSDLNRPVPHVIISDVRMPRRTGPELLREIEPDPRLRGVRTILMSSDATAGKEARCNAFVPKERMAVDLIDTLTRLDAEVH